MRLGLSDQRADLSANLNAKKNEVNELKKDREQMRKELKRVER